MALATLRALCAQVRLLGLAVVLACSLSVAHAQPSFRIDDVAPGLDLAPYLSAFEDRSGQLSFDQVRRQVAEFEPVRDSEASFGFSQSAFWLRWQGQNHADFVRRWLLEVGYAHLDHIQLYAVQDDGSYEVREAGDMLPFAQREVDDPSFVFHFTTPPHARTTFFLRMQTTGSARAPLKAWEERAFYAETARRNVALALFCGAMIVMGVFNVGVFLLIRQPEYLLYVALLFAMIFAQTSLSGHIFQYLLPTHPLLANRAIGVSLAFMLLAIPAFARAVVVRFDIERELRIYDWCMALACALVLFAVLGPAQYALRGVLVVMACACVVAVPHLRVLARYEVEQARLYILSWHVVIYAIPVFVLRLMHVIPAFWLSDWIVQIAATASAVITTLALASRVNVMKDDLARLNDQLSAKVHELKGALSNAELSAEDARRANRIKDDFMATMSHELRTPLNAIINVPQGLIDEFSNVAAVRCAQCAATFMLDPGDVVGPETACGACHSLGKLVPVSWLEYQGEPETTIRYLRKVERAGTHLLQMVNGVLDLSKMEAGRLELSLSSISLQQIIEDSVEQLSELAAQKKLRVEVLLPEARTESELDELRIKQVLLNLLSNAFKFSHEGGAVVVQWEILGESDVVSVRDHGIGVASEHHERIFAGFEQVHTGPTRKFGGTGLGLSISRSLVRMHGGELWVESTLGRGSVFRFSVPKVRPGGAGRPSTAA